jgi:hypothetical protein
MTRHLLTKTLLAISTCALMVNTTVVFAADGHGHGGGTNRQVGPIADYRELTADEKSIQTVLDTYALAMEQKSVEIMEQAIVPNDFSTIESGYPNWTWEDFRDNHLLVEMDTFTDISYVTNLISGELQGALGFAVYKYTASGKVQDKPVSISGLGTAILEATDDGWRIHHLHTSAPRTQLEGMGG